MRIKKRMGIFLLLLVFAVISCMGFYYIKIVSEVNTADIYGLIDNSLTMQYDNLVLYQNINKEEKNTETHGDKMISFIRHVSPNSKIYYYDASDEDGEISTNSVINGLEWMISKDINNVNISLSTKEYSEELESWIQEHKNEIKIFASYSNQLNTFDYPAMYDYVIGSGSDKRIVYKDNDKKYASNIIFLKTNFKIYRGQLISVYSYYGTE